MARSSREVTKILKSYRTPSFPGSFSLVQKFRHALRDRLGIDIQLGELKDILEKDLSYQMSKVRKKNPNQRCIVSNGVTISGQVDTCFINLKIPRNQAEKSKNPNGSEKVLEYYFLMVIDVLSRFIYSAVLPKEINKKSLKKAFEVLLDGPQKMPRFELNFYTY